MTVFSILLALFGLIGCRERFVPPPDPPTIDTNTQQDILTPDPLPILDQMVNAYQGAIAYSDRATVQIVGKMSQTNVESISRNCSVAFQKPNRLRLEVYEGQFVSDGENCYAQILSLPDQVLNVPCLAQWTLETLFQDIHLDAAMRLDPLPSSVLRFPPQLVLLLANNPLNTLYPKGATVEWLERQTIRQVSCDVIRIRHSDGSRILWISQENHALLRLDYQPVGLPVPEGFESIEAIRMEMTDVRFDGIFDPDTFQMLSPQGTHYVTKFQSDTLGLPDIEEHQRKLKLMTDSDSFRIDQHVISVIPSQQSPSPKVAPKTFTLTPAWTVPLVGVHTMEFLPGETPKLLISYEGNLGADLDLKGNVLRRFTPEGLEMSIIMNIRVSVFAEKRHVGILTLDGRLYFLDESAKTLTEFNAGENKKEIIRDFWFLHHNGEELLLLGIQQGSAEEDAVGNSVLRAVNGQGTRRWEYAFEGMVNQISSAVLDDQLCVLVSRTASQDSILMLSPEGAALDSMIIPYGRHAIWFHVLGSTIYALLENTDTGDVRIAGMDKQGKGQWSRLLPPGEYDVKPVYVSTEKMWFFPSPSGEVLVFDTIGNIIDRFSLNIVPTGLLYIDGDRESLLIVADGESVSAWKIGTLSDRLP